MTIMQENADFHEEVSYNGYYLRAETVWTFTAVSMMTIPSKRELALKPVPSILS